MTTRAFLCPSCGQEAMVRKATKKGWHILECTRCGAQRGPFQDHDEIDVA